MKMLAQKYAPQIVRRVPSGSRGSTMKTMTVYEARNHFAKTIEAAKKDVIIVTRNGRPVAAIQAIDDEDVEDLLLERSERFWAMIARARRGRPIAIETLRYEVTGRPAKRRRAAASRSRRRAR
jgi:prevent-host-death family protein